LEKRHSVKGWFEETVSSAALAAIMKPNCNPRSSIVLLYACVGME
jgi:hypothetical protein